MGQSCICVIFHFLSKIDWYLSAVHDYGLKLCYFFDHSALWRFAWSLGRFASTIRRIAPVRLNRSSLIRSIIQVICPFTPAIHLSAGTNEKVA